MIDQVTQKSRGKVDALLAVAGVDVAGPPIIAINYYGALATLEGLRPLLFKVVCSACGTSSTTPQYSCPIGVGWFTGLMPR
jgi:hypothetical protein